MPCVPPSPGTPPGAHPIICQSRRPFHRIPVSRARNRDERATKNSGAAHLVPLEAPHEAKPVNDRGAEGHLDVQAVAAARAGASHLSRDHAAGIECLHLQMATLIELQDLPGRCFIGGVLIRYSGISDTAGIARQLRYPLLFPGRP